MASSRNWRPGTRSMMVLSALALGLGLILVITDSSAAAETVGLVLISAGWGATAYLALRQRDIAAQALRTSREERKQQRGDVQKAHRELAGQVSKVRSEQARQAQRQERTLTRIEEALRQIKISELSAAFHPEQDSKIDVLFVTSNGAGLGHVTRLLAIAENLPVDYRYELLTLSKAYEQVQSNGLTVHYFPSSDATQERPSRWNRIFRSYFGRLVEGRRPRVVVFDGTWVYSGITDVCRANDIPLVWVQRGMWKDERDRTSQQRHDVIKVADEVIIPGDFAGAEDVDTGSDVAPLLVGPIVRTARTDLLSRTEACEMLGLDPSGVYALVNVGRRAVSTDAWGGADISELLHEVCPGITPVQVVSPLAPEGSASLHAEHVRVYPVMPLVRAFEFAVSAAGYNSSQEAVALGVPTILVPDTTTVTDDQERRARQLAKLGLVLTAGNVEELQSALSKISSPGVRESLLAAMSRLEAPRGAVEAAQALHATVERAKWPRQATTIGA